MASSLASNAKRTATVLVLGLLAALTIVGITGCVSPPPTISAVAALHSNLRATGGSQIATDDSKSGASFWVVDARAACRQSKTFQPDQLGYGRIHSSEDKPEPSSLAALIAESDPTIPLCIMVHGYGFSASRAIEDARWASHYLRHASGDRPFQFLVFSWRSELERSIPWPLLARDMRIKAKRADIAANYLAWLVGKLPPDQPVCLVGHSLGCQVVACALNLLGGGESRLPSFAMGPPPPRPLRAVLLAAAMDQDSLCPGQKFEMAASVAQEILVLKNPKDTSLRWYPLLNIRRARALGYQGFSDRSMVQLSSTAEKIRVISVSEHLGKAHNFRAYLASRPIAELIASAIQFEPTNVAFPSRGQARITDLTSEP